MRSDQPVIIAYIQKYMFAYAVVICLVAQRFEQKKTHPLLFLEFSELVIGFSSKNVVDASILPLKTQARSASMQRLIANMNCDNARFPHKQ